MTTVTAGPAIVPVVADSEVFERVVALWGEQRATLGLFPRGAFQDRARAGGLLAATLGDTLAGFVTFRVSRQRATIVHLCVHADHRCSGIARRLLRAVCERAPAGAGSVRAACRRDFDANAMWPRLGFVCVGERPGRGNPPGVLNLWALDLRRDDLFTAVERESFEATTPVVIDAHVFFDLVDETRTRSEESRALIQDWAAADLTVYLTDEIFNEIARHPDAGSRDRFRAAAHAYPRVTSSLVDYEAALAGIGQIMGPASDDADASDRRHLAHAVAAGVVVFATRDTGILEFSNEIYDATGVNVVHPGEVFLRLDELADEARYRPARLPGSSLQHARVRAGEIDDVVDATARNETVAERGRLRALVRDTLGQEDSCSTVVRNSVGEVVALLLTRRISEHETEIQLARASRAPLAATLVRHLLAEEIRAATEEGITALRVSAEVAAAHAEALHDAGFIECDGVTRRVIGPRSLERENVVAWLDGANTRVPCGQVAALLHAAQAGAENPNLLTGMERVLWPTMILGAGVGSWIVPIRPNFARHLFDRRLADQDLFGPREDLSLSYQNAYFRRPRNSAGLRPPGRVFWYVSQGEGTDVGVMAVRAYSRLDEVRVGGARQVFRALRHLGVYRWAHILETANGDADGEVMALRFSLTQQLQSPTPFARAQALLATEDNAPPTFQSPVAIGDEVVRRLLAGPTDG